MQHTPSNVVAKSFPTDLKHLRIGTRGSQLALAQADEVKSTLLDAFPEVSADQLEIIPMTTTGDRLKDKNLTEEGGKGLFIKEIEGALLAGEIDIAVHSTKDLPATLPGELVIGAVLRREDPRDAFISHNVSSLQALPQGATIGTSSPRRKAQLLITRPDLRIVPFRGNVTTRLRKLDAGEVDATLLAFAGLKRVGQEHVISSILDTDMMLPAIGQGAICIECHKKNQEIKNMLTTINDTSSALCVTTERMFLSILEGSCSTPIAGLATILDGERIDFQGLIASIDGKKIYRTNETGPMKDAALIGTKAGKDLKCKLGI